MNEKRKLIKKCPICDLNYISENERCCSLCKQDKAISYDNYTHHRTRVRSINNPTEKVCDYSELKRTKAKEDLLNKLNEHGFNGFFHTTDMPNFIKIYKSKKLCSRNYLLNKGIYFEDNANKDIIEKTGNFVKNCVRFYFREITPTNISAFYNFNQTQPVLIQFNKELIYSKKTFFCDGNAASNLTIIHGDAKNAINIDWKTIFSTNSFSSDDILKKNRRNAEFLILTHFVDLKFVKYFYFRNEEDKKFAISKLGYDHRFKVDPSKFYSGEII